MNSPLVNYTFNASAKTVTLTDVASADTKRVRFIKNLTTNTFIYSFTDTSVSQITASTNVITFTGSNSGMSNSDSLAIQYDLSISLDTQIVKISQGGNDVIVNSNGSITVAGVSTVGTAPVNPPIGISGVDGGGLKRTLLTKTDGTLLVDSSANTQPISAVSLPTLSDKGATGNLTTTDSTVVAITNGAGTVIAEIGGTWSGTIIFEGSNNSFTTQQAITSIYLGGIQTQSSTTTINGFFSIVCAGFAQVRCRMNPYTSGTATILMNVSSEERIMVPLQGNPDNNNTLSKQGAAGSAPWPTILTSSTTALALGIKATMTAYGYQRMTLEPKVIFSDPFDGTVVDITNRWTQTGTVTQLNSLTQIGNVLTVSTVNRLISQPTFPPLGLNFLVGAFVASFETTPLSTTNVNRFVGFGIHSGTPSLSLPITDGVGFEWDNATSKLYGAVWQNGVRSASSVDLTTSVTSSFTRYAILFRSDLVIFYINGTEYPVGNIQFVTPGVQTLPFIMQTVIGGSTPNTTPLMQIGAVGIGDTGGNSTQLSDGDLPYIKQNIKKSNTLATSSDKGLVTRNAPIKKTRVTFAKAVASGADTEFFNTLVTGAGQTVSQSGGNLIITAGTTINSETIIRSIDSYTDNIILKYTTILSQRIVNNRFFVELVDILGDGLAITISSATAVTVTIPNNTLTSGNVGQSTYLGNYSGTGTFLPGRYTIASVSGNNITYTVAGFAAGSGTCSVFGLNYHQILYDSTTATNTKYDTQRKGYNTGFTTATINTTAGSGHMGIMTNEDGNAAYLDQLTASSSSGVQSTLRATRVQNMPDENIPLFIQFRSSNGSVAPASNTTWTIGTLAVENYTPTSVAITNIKNQGNVTALPVQVLNTPTVTATNLSTNLAQIGGNAPVTAGVNGTLAVGGNIATGTARTANPTPIGGVDINNLTRVALFDVIGNMATIGPGETISQFSLGTGAASVTDGTNGKTIFIPARESDVYLAISAISTSPTMQLEGSYDNINFSVIPLSTVDNTATAQQYNAQAAFTPAAGKVYKGKSYGFPILRIHLTAGSASNTVGTLRVVPIPIEIGQSVSHFALNAASTTESTGSANGQIQTGGVKTLNIMAKGSNKAILHVDGVTGTLTYALEGSVDGTIFNALPMQSLAGGATVTSVSATGTTSLPASGIYEADLSNMIAVRVHCTSFTSGIIFGSLKIVNIPSQVGIQNSFKPTYSVSVTGLAPTTSTNVTVIESGATKITRIKRIIIQPGSATASGIATLTLNRNTVAASASGTSITSSSMQRDTTDPSYTGIVRTGAFTVVGVTSTASQIVIPVPTPISTSTIFMQPIIIDFTESGTLKGLAIPVGVTNGGMFTHSGLAGAAGFGLIVEFTEE